MEPQDARTSQFSVRRSLAWMAISQAFLFVLQFGASLILARLLTPYEMGVFALAHAVVGLLSVLRTLGLGSYIIRATTLDDTMLACVFTINAAIAVSVALLVAGASLLGGLLFSEDGVRRALLVLALMPLISLFEFLPAARLEREGAFGRVAALNVARACVGTGVTLCLAFAGASYMSLVWGQIAGAVVSVVGFNLVGRRYASLRLALSGWREVLRFGLHILAIGGVAVLASRLSEVAMGRLLGLSALGLYSRASSLNSLLWDSVHIVIARVVMVDFSDHARRGKGLHDVYLRTVRMVTALLWPAFAGLAVVAGPVVLLFYGEPWIGAALPLSLLSLASLVLTSITMTWEVYVVSHQTARQARFEFIRAGIGFVLFVLGCLGGLAWAAAAKLAEAVFSFNLYRRDLQRMTDTGFTELAAIYLGNGGLTLVAITPAAAVMAWHGWSPATPFSLVISGVALGVVAWLAMLFATRHPLAAELTRLASTLRAGIRR